MMERFANVLLAVAVLAFAGTAAYRLKPHQPPRPVDSPFHAGAAAPKIAGLQYGAADRTLLLFVSTNCHFCEASVPFYNQLKASTRTGAALFAVFAEQPAQVTQFAARMNLSADVVSGVHFGRFGVSATPTSLLVDREGRVVNSWIGVSASGEAEMMAALR